jgi:hypothetical protein
MVKVFLVLPLIANEPLGVGGLSYAGALTIGIAADRDASPDLDVWPPPCATSCTRSACRPIPRSVKLPTRQTRRQDRHQRRVEHQPVVALSPQSKAASPIRRDDQP